ncbi:hypothetical protein CPB97_000953 [Podila verticillata]|nr:hypothetical protein CPB97_000953 [Podila verticillata]
MLGIYSLLVLTSILGSEFVMLYTQSPLARGGLEFSAQTLGQVLTMRGILKLTFNLLGYPFMVQRLGLVHCLRLGIAVIGTVSTLGMGWFVPWSVEREKDIEMTLATTTTTTGNSHFNSSSGAMMMSDRTPIGMSVVLLCMSMISMGDVLGYISVLVLFGKSADRFKGTNKNAAGSDIHSASDRLSTQPSQQQQSGSGVLWSVAQVSANVMRLTGPVLAGLLWTLTGQGPHPNPDDTKGHPPPSHILSESSSESETSTYTSSQTTFSMKPMGETMAPNDDGSSFATIATWIFNGPTSVFYLVGAICVLNFVACQFLVLSESSSSSPLSSSSPSGPTRDEEYYTDNVDPEKVPREIASSSPAIPRQRTGPSKCPVHPRRSSLAQVEDA